jgi:hypothetical protein
MRRRLFNFLAALSLLTSMASLGLWLRGRYVIDELTWRREGGGGERTVWEEWRLRGGKGVVSLTRETEWHFPTPSALAPGSPVTDVGPPVVGPPAVPLGPYRFRRRELNPASVLVLPPSGLGEKLGFRLQDFAFESPSVGHGGRTRQVRLPYGALVSAAALPPLAWAMRRRLDPRRRRGRRGLCPACGYDVRATPDRCPECGTAAAKVA